MHAEAARAHHPGPHRGPAGRRRPAVAGDLAAHRLRRRAASTWGAPRGAGGGRPGGGAHRPRPRPARRRRARREPGAGAAGAAAAGGGAPGGGRPGGGDAPPGGRRRSWTTAARWSDPTTGCWRPAADAIGAAAAVALTPPAEGAATFHGRDLFAPAAARIARGVPVTDLGEPFDPASLVQPDLPPAEVRRRSPAGPRGRDRPVRQRPVAGAAGRPGGRRVHARRPDLGGGDGPPAPGHRRPGVRRRRPQGDAGAHRLARDGRDRGERRQTPRGGWAPRSATRSRSGGGTSAAEAGGDRVGHPAGAALGERQEQRGLHQLELQHHRRRRRRRGSGRRARRAAARRGSPPASRRATASSAAVGVAGRMSSSTNSPPTTARPGDQHRPLAARVAQARPPGTRAPSPRAPPPPRRGTAAPSPPARRRGGGRRAPPPPRAHVHSTIPRGSFDTSRVDRARRHGRLHHHQRPRRARPSPPRGRRRRSATAGTPAACQVGEVALVAAPAQVRGRVGERR